MAFRHLGTFKVKDIISAVKGACGANGLDVLESSHKFKAGPGGEEVVKLTADKKQTDYVRFTIDITVAASDLKDVEVVEGGKKKKMQHGRVEVTVKPKMTTDWQKRWSSSKTREKLKKVYEKYLASGMVDRWEDKLDEIAGEITEAARKSVGLI